MSEYNAKDAVSMAFEGNVNGFRDTVNNLLLDKIYDAVQMKKFDVSANMFNDEVVEEEVDLDLEEKIEIEIDGDEDEDEDGKKKKKKKKDEDDDDEMENESYGKKKGY